MMLFYHWNKFRTWEPCCVDEDCDGLYIQLLPVLQLAQPRGHACVSLPSASHIPHLVDSGWNLDYLKPAGLRRFSIGLHLVKGE